MSGLNRRSKTALSLSVATAGMVLVGCTGNVITASDATATSTVAFVSIDRLNTPTAVAATDQDGTAVAVQPAAPSFTTSLNASAIILRAPAGTDERLVAWLVGADIALPQPDHCEPVEVLHDESMSLSSLGPIDLVDVGEVAIETEGGRVPLAPQAFPNLADLVSGMVYTTRDRAGAGLSDHGVFRLRTSGSASFGPAVLEASSPGTIPGLLIAGRRLTDTPIALPRTDISLDWEGSSDDLVYIDLATMDDGPVERVRCTFRDSGHGTLPASVLPHGQTQRLSAHKLHKQAVITPGLDGGAFRVDEAVTVSLRFEEARP